MEIFNYKKKKKKKKKAFGASLDDKIKVVCLNSHGSPKGKA
jgi:hypothetical protein